MVYDSTVKKTSFHQDIVNIDLRVWKLPYFKCFFKSLLNHMYNLVLFYRLFSLISGRLSPIRLLKHVIVQEDFFFKFIQRVTILCRSSLGENTDFNFWTSLKNNLVNQSGSTAAICISLSRLFFRRCSKLKSDKLRLCKHGSLCTAGHCLSK